MNLQDNIARMEQELADMKKKLEQQDKLVLSDGHMVWTFLDSNISNILDDGNNLESIMCKNCQYFAVFRDEFGTCNKGFNNHKTARLHQSFACNVFERKK